MEADKSLEQNFKEMLKKMKDDISQQVRELKTGFEKFWSKRERMWKKLREAEQRINELEEREVITNNVLKLLLGAEKTMRDKLDYLGNKSC